MTKYFCDICQEELYDGKESNIYYVELSSRQGFWLPNGKPTYKLMLCLKHYNIIYQFLKRITDKKAFNNQDGKLSIVEQGGKG